MISWRNTCIFTLVAAFGCGDVSPTELPSSQRVVSVEIDPADATKLSLRPVALQLAAVAVDARLDSPVLDFRASRAVSPGSNSGAPVRMSVALEMDRSYLLYLQVPVDGRVGLGRMVGRLLFQTGQGSSRTSVLNGRAVGINSALSDLDLGLLTLTSGRSDADDSSRDLIIEVGEDTSVNPLSANDSDADGTPDFDDADDDNDFIPDDVDDDSNGDDIPDSQQSYEALLKFDADGDQVPDLFQP